MYLSVVGAINWTDLHLSPVAVDLGFFQLKWYSLAYLAGIFAAYFYMLKLLDQPGAPLARRHADDLVFYSSLGVILGGRLGYVLFYNLWAYSTSPARTASTGFVSTIMSPVPSRSACSSGAAPIS